MLIYEVNLTVEPAIYRDYLIWLKAHIQEILCLPGFKNATLSVEEPQHKLCVQYYLDTEENLYKYLEDYAPKMRADGIARFADKFIANRRILKIEKEF